VWHLSPVDHGGSATGDTVIYCARRYSVTKKQWLTVKLDEETVRYVYGRRKLTAQMP
jgi:hypothetical protein